MDHPINKQLNLYGQYRNSVLAKDGMLFRAFSFAGIDPKALYQGDFVRLTGIFQRLLQNLNSDITVSQYYCHYDNAKVSIRDRDNDRAHMLSKRREAFLNEQRNLSGSRIFWLLGQPQDQNLNKLSSVWFISQLLQIPFDKKARQLVLNKLKARDQLLFLESELDRQYNDLEENLDTLVSRMDNISLAHELSNNELYGLYRSVCNLDFDYLDHSGEAPLEDWDNLGFDGDVIEVNVEGMDCLKLTGPNPRYVRIASVSGYGEEYTPEGTWGRGDGAGNKAVTMQAGNYIICNRFTPLSRFRKASFVKSKHDELYRQTLSVKDLMSGNASGEAGFQSHVNSSPQLKEMLDDLNEISFSDMRYGYFNSHIIMFNEDPKVLKKACRSMNQAMLQSGIYSVWESAGLTDAYFNCMPGVMKRSVRSFEMNTAQVGAASLVFKSHSGQRQWARQPETEEAMYIFESDDGSPFYYSPYVGEKCLTVGVGPTRSGKSFTKNTLAGHFMKYGGLYQSIDMDPGTEPLAKFYGTQAGIFTIDERRGGFNPFCVAQGVDDVEFISHLTEMIREMVKMNESASMQELNGTEQGQLDYAIRQVLQQEDRELRTLSNVADHCEKSVREKLARWINKGANAQYFDNVDDAIGSIDRMFTVYNLKAVKERKELAALITKEIFFRIVRLFESPEYRTTPKFLEIDEAQYFLSIKGSPELVEAKSRTWFKFFGGMGLWTQSPSHYRKLDGWETIRSSASTFIFMADAEMNEESYRSTFSLTDGEIQTIANLKPQQQALIKQPEIGVSKVVNLFTAPEEYAIATSRANEAVHVEQCLKEFNDVDEAIAEAIKRMKLTPTETNDV